MGMPRDYYTDEYGEPSLHSLHGSRPYVERDNLADMAHDQLPTLSTIGAGPQGAGVVPVPVVGDPGSYRFQLVSDETGEVLLTSDNLHPGEISVWSPAHEWVAGEAEIVYIRVRRGDEVDEYPVEIPPGAVGSRWFVGPEAEYSPSNVYYFQVDDLQYDGLNSYRGKPVPRPNDLCAFLSGHDLVLGNVDACEAGTVVVVARTYIPAPVPEIGENGNWIVDGVDTGQPSKGDRGDDGLNAVVRIGNVEALPPGKASATMNVDVEKNVYTLNLGIPEGAPGKAIDIQGGIWTTDTLPDYDDTEVNTAFIVHDNDKQFDLYIRGRIPVTASDGGPWTVVEDWQGRPGTGTHMLRKPYVLGKSEGSIVRVPASELSLAFAPYDYMSDGDIVIDTEMSVGILGSTEDDSGDYTVETMGTVTAKWENVEGKPFDAVLEGDGLVVAEASLDGEALGKVLGIDPDSLSPKWDMVREKPVDVSGWLFREMAFDSERGTMLDARIVGSGVPAGSVASIRVFAGANVNFDSDAVIVEDGETFGPSIDMEPKMEELGLTWNDLSFAELHFKDPGDIYTKMLDRLDFNTWDRTVGKPSVFPHDEVKWEEVTGKPETYPHGEITWEEISGKPEVELKYFDPAKAPALVADALSQEA